VSAEYRLDIHTSDGVKVAEVTDYLDLAYSKRVNAPGLLQFTLPGDHRVIGELEHDGQVIVYRRNAALGLPWTADFWGLLRYQRRYFTDRALYEARAPGLLSLPRRLELLEAGAGAVRVMRLLHPIPGDRVSRREQ
jgi:hypothetical protein